LIFKYRWLKAEFQNTDDTLTLVGKSHFESQRRVGVVIIAVDDNRTAWKSVLSWSRIMEKKAQTQVKI